MTRSGWPAPLARSLRAGIALVAAVLLGAGVATAALTADPDTAPVTTQDRSGDETAPEDPDPSAIVAPVACEDARTHGEYVSSVARSTPPGPGKGAAVSAAARSDCGKPVPARDTETAGEPEGGGGPPHVPPGLAKKGLTEPPGHSRQPGDESG